MWTRNKKKTQEQGLGKRVSVEWGGGERQKLTLQSNKRRINK